ILPAGPIRLTISFAFHESPRDAPAAARRPLGHPDDQGVHRVDRRVVTSGELGDGAIDHAVPLQQGLAGEGGGGDGDTEVAAGAFDLGAGTRDGALDEIAEVIRDGWAGVAGRVLAHGEPVLSTFSLVAPQ